MVVEEGARRALHARLETVLGNEHAVTLMDHVVASNATIAGMVFAAAGGA